MRQGQTRQCSTIIIAALAFLIVGMLAPGGMRLTWAAVQSLSDAQLKKVNALIADQGRDVAISSVITDILGLTSDNQTIHAALSRLSTRGATTKPIRSICCRARRAT
jgi:hypothetical protein